MAHITPELAHGELFGSFLYSHSDTSFIRNEQQKLFASEILLLNFRISIPESRT